MVDSAPVARLVGLLVPAILGGGGADGPFGDPTAAGWAITGLYAAAACGAFAAVWRARAAFLRGDDRAWNAFVFWLLTGAAMVFLGVNKQLDLQLFLLFEGKRMATSQGWYPIRRVVQFAFVAAVGLGCVVGVVALRGMAGRVGQGAWMAVVGLAVLTGFIIVRATSPFHSLDDVLMRGWHGLSLVVVLEASGAAFVMLGALFACRSGRVRLRPPSR